MNPELPIVDYLPLIQDHLKGHNSVVITAEPGAGKTTRLPPSLLDYIPGKILVLEPRRVAALAAASRISTERNWTLGKEVGYQVRFDNKTTPETRLIFMTEAMLSRLILKNPELNGIGAIVLDEFHERSIHSDLALGWIKELQELGSNIKLIVMSATLQTEEVSNYLGQVPIVKVPGKLFPLEIEYQKYSLRPILDTDFYKQVASVVQTKAQQTEKDLLVFLPGVGEIGKLQETLSSWASQKNIPIYQLHGSLNLEQQREVLFKSSQQRIILATNIAESSITVDGVGVVIDTGLSKVMRFDHRTGFGRLELGRISLSSSVQRAGRAARQFEGLAVRMWSKSDELSMSQHEVPEIQRSDLTDSFLFLAANGITDFEKFSWFEKPNSIAIQKAISTLKIIKALDAEGRITDLGKKLMDYPLPIKMALLMELAERQSQANLGADLVAILQERDFTDKKSSQKYLGDKLECDVAYRWQELQEYRRGKRSYDINSYRIQNVLNASKQFAGSSAKTLHDSFDHIDIKKLILHSHLENLCKRRGKSDRGLMVGGRGVRLEPETLVQESEFFVTLVGREAEGRSETLVSVACGFDKDFLLKEISDQIKTQVDLYYDEDKQKFFSRKYKAFRDLALDEPSLEPANPDLLQDQMPDVLLSKWEWVLKNNETLNFWYQRWEYFRISKGYEVFPTDKLRQALAMASVGENNLNFVASKDLVYFLEMQMDSKVLHEFQKEVPAKIQMPTGSWIPVRYPEGRDPFLEVRIQEVFGLKETPKILGGTVSIVFHLLAPNYRPTQVTKDLKSFWSNGYVEVRKELRLKYPKHSWPEDPLTAPPVAKGRSQKK